MVYNWINVAEDESFIYLRYSLFEVVSRQTMRIPWMLVGDGYFRGKHSRVWSLIIIKRRRVFVRNWCDNSLDISVQQTEDRLNLSMWRNAEEERKSKFHLRDHRGSSIPFYINMMKKKHWRTVEDTKSLDANGTFQKAEWGQIKESQVQYEDAEWCMIKWDKDCRKIV